MLNSSFNESCTQYRQFLETNGYSPEVMWVTPHDILLAGHPLVYVKVPVPSSNQLRARELFERGMTRQLGVSFGTVCEIEGATCCYVWVPADDQESQNALMPRDLKMSAKTGESRISGRQVRSRARWWYLNVLHRQKQELEGHLFWG